MSWRGLACGFLFGCATSCGLVGLAIRQWAFLEHVSGRSIGRMPRCALRTGQLDWDRLRIDAARFAPSVLMV